jgi:hypothetical protein
VPTSTGFAGHSPNRRLLLRKRESQSPGRQMCAWSSPQSQDKLVLQGLDEFLAAFVTTAGPQVSSHRSENNAIQSSPPNLTDSRLRQLVKHRRFKFQRQRQAPALDAGAGFALARPLRAPAATQRANFASPGFRGPQHPGRPATVPGGSGHNDRPGAGRVEAARGAAICHPSRAAKRDGLHGAEAAPLRRCVRIER